MKVQSALITSFLQVILLQCIAQPSIEWQRCYGGSENEEGRCIRPTSDGGFIIAGFSESEMAYQQNGDVMGHHGSHDWWVVKIDSQSNIEWAECLGGSYQDLSYSVVETSSGDFIVVGKSNSEDFDVSMLYGCSDIWVVKLDENGTVIWEKSFGGEGCETALNIIETTSEEYIICGNSTFIENGIWDTDAFVLLIDTNGNLIWQKMYGGSGNDIAYEIMEIAEGGFIVLSASNSIDGDVLNNIGESDIWLFKINVLGEIVWQRTFGGSQLDVSYDFDNTDDGGLIVAASSYSDDFDIMGNNGGTDMNLIKLNSDGIIEWTRNYGGSGFEGGSIINAQYGYVMAIRSGSEDGDVPNNHGLFDLWLVAVDEFGEIIWSQCYGGSGYDYINSFCEADGGFVLAGRTTSDDGDVSGIHGGSDVWVVKLSEDVHVKEDVAESLIEVFPTNPTDQLYVKSNSLFKGQRFSIVDMTGKEVKTGIINADQIEIGISDLASGPYLFRINGEASEIVKFIKE
jgi:hypothetical protein